MMLFDCKEGTTTHIVEMNINDEEFKEFLFSLGCYEGEEITVISKKRHAMVVAVKDGRYNIDEDIARVIKVA